MPARAAVIGAGLIAGQHLACLKDLREVETVAVCDLSPSVAEAAAERYEIPTWFTDYREMIGATDADVVHVLTPPPSHFRLALDALESGAHVIVEKPITAAVNELHQLVAQAQARQRWLIEDYNYVFNGPVQRVLRLIKSGEFGDVVHVHVSIALDIVSPGHPFTDPGASHPVRDLAAGPISDFLPHLASLAYFFVGPHRALSTAWRKRSPESVPIVSDEFRALVEAEQGTASLSFSAHSQPDAMWLRVDGTRMRAAVNIYEQRLTIDRLRNAPQPLIPLLNGIAEAGAVGGSAIGSLWSKLAGRPGDYEGLWELLRRTYESLDRGGAPPVSLTQIEDVNRLVSDLTDERFRL